MKKTVSLLLTALLTIQCVMAQHFRGIQNLNYTKYNTARDLLKKAYDANPKDPQTVYWYGQALIGSDGDPTKDQIAAAKAVYQKGLQDIGNDAWLVTGMGHLELLEGGDINSAKQKFEQAITSSTETKGKNKGKPNPNILAAIGRANADGGSKIGDPVYGIDKLKQAAALDLINSDIFINMGINYQKMGGENGGEAVKAYQEAVLRDPKSALAFWHIGKIYLSQNNKELLEDFFNKSIAADSSFPPVYLSYYEYFSNKDVNRAKNYLDKFIATADKDPKNDFFLAEYLFRAGKYNESLAKEKELESTIGTVLLPRLNIQYAYNYDRLGDSVQSKTYLDKYFATVPPDVIQPTDYELAAKVYTKFPGNEDTAAVYIDKAIQMDTLLADRLNYIKQAADMYAKAKNPKKQLVWLKRGVELKKETSITDYYYLIDASIKSADQEKDSTARTAALQDAAKMSADMIQKYPDQIYGYRFATQAAVALDADTSKGTAVPAVQQYITFLSKDPAKNARILPYQFYYLASYYHDKVKDFPKTLEILNALLTLYPEDKYGLQVKPIVEKEISGPAKSAKPQSGNAGSTSPKPASSSGK